MKIAILRQRVTGFGGAETTLRALVRGLAQAGHEVVVFGAGTDGRAQETLGSDARYVPVRVWGGKTQRLLGYAFKTRKLLRKDNFQVVFSLERTVFQHVYRAGDGCHREWLERRAELSSWPAVVARHLSLFHRAMLHLERLLFTDPNLGRVIANSRQVREEIIRHYAVEPDRIEVIYNGLEHAKFRPLPEASREALRVERGAPADSRVVLFVGSGFARKGLAYLVKAFAGLKNDRCLLWVVGKGAAASYQRLAKRLGVGQRVRFWGPQNEVAPFYQAASVLALPTLYDPCSNVVLEALACGSPVVTTAANGAAEFLTPGENGEILSRPDDVAGLHRALTACIERHRDPRVRTAAQEAVAHLNWDLTVSKTMAVLEEAAA
jgi:UDP-glucose:(heptosyl)LPS alpha-1,3-glucosyltransferase